MNHSQHLILRQLVCDFDRLAHSTVAEKLIRSTYLCLEPASASTPTVPDGTEGADDASAVNTGDIKNEEPVPHGHNGTAGEGTVDAPMEIVDTEDGDSKPVTVATTPAVEQAPQLPQPSQPQVYPGGFTIDVAFEASKLPLDVAIFNSARAAGGDDKIRKYLQAVLVIGGTALVPGMAHALESRYVRRSMDSGLVTKCCMN